MQISIAVATDKSKNDDMAEVMTHPEGLVIALADGASGVGFGHVAARIFIDRVRGRVRPETFISGCGNLVREFREIDFVIAEDVIDADTTGIVVIGHSEWYWGCSVGDSEAWLIKGDQRVELTANQHRKPRIGSGQARPVAFGPAGMSGATLLIGSDGLFKSLDWSHIEPILRKTPPNCTANALLAATRAANSGVLPDDFSTVVVSF